MAQEGSAVEFVLVQNTRSASFQCARPGSTQKADAHNPFPRSFLHVHSQARAPSYRKALAYCRANAQPHELPLSHFSRAHDPFPMTWSDRSFSKRPHETGDRSPDELRTIVPAHRHVIDPSYRSWPDRLEDSQSDTSTQRTTCGIDEHGKRDTESAGGRGSDAAGKTWGNTSNSEAVRHRELRHYVLRRAGHYRAPCECLGVHG